MAWMPLDRLRLVALLSVLLFAGVARSEPPKAVVIGPTGGVPGDILLLDASESVGDSFGWEVTPELPNQRPTILVLEGGRKCLVTSVPGGYTVFCAVSNAEGVDTLKHVINVGTQPSPPPAPPGPTPPGPAPGPTPVPTPIPEPSPPGKFTDVMGELLQLARAIDPAARAATLDKLAAAWLAIADQLKEGKVTALNALLLAHRMQALLVAANDSAVGPHAAAWQAFGRAVGVRIVSLYAAGRLNTAADWESLLREGAAVLLQAKG